MKKSITSLIISVAFAGLSSYSYAEDLATVYSEALANDPTVLKAKAQFLASKETIEQARSALLPQIYGSATYSKTKSDSQQINNDFSNIDITSTYDYRNASLNLSMELYHHDTWQKMDNAKKTAHLGDVSYQVAKQQLLTRVTSAYFAVLKAQDDLEFAKAERKAIERQLEQTKQRFAVGLTAITDVHEAQAKFDNAQTNVIVAENTIAMRQEELRAITNVYPGKLSVLNTKSFSTTIPSPNTANEWQAIAESKNLQIIAQKISTDIAKEQINIAQSGHLPTLDLTGSYGKSSSRTSISASAGSISYPYTPYFDSKSIGISLTVPIYSGGATSSYVRQAQHNYVASSQDLELVHRSVVQNVRTAYNTVKASISAIKSLQQSVISAESALKATEAGFEVGTRTIVDVLNSTQNLYNAKRNLSSTRYNYIESVLALKLSAGTISESDLVGINKGLKSVQ